MLYQNDALPNSVLPNDDDSPTDNNLPKDNDLPTIALDEVSQLV